MTEELCTEHVLNRCIIVYAGSHMKLLKRLVLRVVANSKSNDMVSVGVYMCIVEEGGYRLNTCVRFVCVTV